MRLVRFEVIFIFGYENIPANKQIYVFCSIISKFGTESTNCKWFVVDNNIKITQFDFKTDKSFVFDATFLQHEQSSKYFVYACVIHYKCRMMCTRKMNYHYICHYMSIHESCSNWRFVLLALAIQSSSDELEMQANRNNDILILFADIILMIQSECCKGIYR